MFLVSIAFFYSLIICALYDVYMYKVNKDYYYYYVWFQVYMVQRKSIDKDISVDDKECV